MKPIREKNKVGSTMHFRYFDNVYVHIHFIILWDLKDLESIYKTKTFMVSLQTIKRR